MEKTLDDYKPATIDELADALDALVTELVRYRKLRQVQAENEEWPSEPFRLVSFATLTKVPNDVLRQRSIVENPVERALKHGMVEVGKLMYANLKSTDKMVPIVEDVCDRDHKRYGQRIGILDSTFNGIGEGNDIWVS